MRYRLCLAFLLIMSMTTFLALRAKAQENAVERFGLYVVAEDLDRASAFYEELFETKPQVRNAGLVGFDVAGGLYAVVSKQAYAPNMVRGDNAVPYIKVRNIFAAFERVKRLAPAGLKSDKVIEEGPFKFFKFSDPDGNIIEFFSVTATP